MTDPVVSRSLPPSIVLVSEDHADRLREEFWRYSREYDLRVAHSCAEAMTAAEQVIAGGGTVALFVTDSRLPDVGHVFEAIHRWRMAVPTADARRRRGRATSSSTPPACGSAWRRASSTPTC